MENRKMKWCYVSRFKVSGDNIKEAKVDASGTLPQQWRIKGNKTGK